MTVLAETMRVEPRRVRARRAAWPMPLALRRVLLLGPPLLLAGLEILHPQPDENAQALMDASTWFAGFHVIQLALTGLVGLSVLLLADSFGRAKCLGDASWGRCVPGLLQRLRRRGGIGTGLAMRSARDLSAVQQEGVFDVVKDWPAVGPPFALSIVGTLGWVAAVGALALAARRQGAPRLEWIFIGLAAVLLLGGHPFPLGTLAAFGCFFIGALRHELRASCSHSP